uniref:Uncharacterized protein n=1 Tax=Wuchereria bancrofti TaxID=6293 RepID=A0A1I8EJ86_WUCBA
MEDIYCDEVEDMIVPSIEQSIQISEEKLREKNERLQIERELLEMKNWTLQTLQLQFATILKRLNTISIPFAPASSVFISKSTGKEYAYPCYDSDNESLLSQSARICHFRPSDSEISAMVNGDFNNNFQQQGIFALL